MKSYFIPPFYLSAIGAYGFRHKLVDVLSLKPRREQYGYVSLFIYLMYFDSLSTLILSNPDLLFAACQGCTGDKIGGGKSKGWKKKKKREENLESCSKKLRKA